MGSPRTWTPLSRSSTPSGSSPPTSPTSCPRSCAWSCRQTRLSTVFRGCSPTPAWTLSREPLTTCPSPLHCMESPICRLGRPLPRPKNDFTSRTPWLFGLDQPMPRRRQVASQQEPPDHSFENHLNVKIPSKASSPSSPAATFSYLDINTKNDLFCFVRRVNSVACCSSPLRWWLIPKSMALHVTDCNSVFVAELLEIQIETINVNEERSL